MAEDCAVVRIAPYHYIYVLNLSTHATRLVLGPKVFVCLQDEKVTHGPEPMITVPPMKYCLVLNPVAKLPSGEPATDKYGQVKLRVGDMEYRFSQDPFPLYPGEKLKGEVSAVPVLTANKALRLCAVVDFFDDGCHVNRSAGEEWLFVGPGIYHPRKEVEILQTEVAKEIKPNTALCIHATKDCIDSNGTSRSYGEKWLVKTPGAYLPGPYEEFIEIREAYEITQRSALHMKAVESHTDEFGNKRKYGEEWLITLENTSSHICGVYEEVVKVVDIIVLDAHEYCIVLNPVDEFGVAQWGHRKLVRGEKSFFLKPGEELESGIQHSYVLLKGQGLILRANQKFVDKVPPSPSSSEEFVAEPSIETNVVRNPGDQWMIYGPVEYVPPIEVDIVSHQSIIPLDRNEGIYVRNMRTGQIRAVIGKAYMLNQDEELWEKKLPVDVLEIITGQKDPVTNRSIHSTTGNQWSGNLDLTRVVTYRVPHNAAIQIYDYRERTARVEFGPKLVMLQPDEQFTKLSLSGGKPKRPNVIQSLCLLLGPDFSTDIIVVETADHARLSLQLSYNWVFDVPTPCSKPDAAKLFAVPDFVADICKTMASRIRGAVASVQFDDFHKNSARIIRSSVFGFEANGKMRDRFIFPANNLHITNVDIQSVEPVDQNTRESLQKSVQLAIEITTSSLEAAARHEAERLEQEARGRLERQRIEDESAAEEARHSLLKTRVELQALEITGQARAKAESQAEAARIESEAAVAQAKLRAEALSIETDNEIQRLQKTNTSEVAHQMAKDELEIKFKQEETQIIVNRFTSMMKALGQDTLHAIATAGAEHNVRMLHALGLQSTLITDGHTPINLLTTAHGLIGKALDPQCNENGGGLPRSDPQRPKKPRKPFIVDDNDEEDCNARELLTA